MSDDSEIEAIREQIAALYARLKPLLAQQRTEARREAVAKAEVKVERRLARIEQMLAWHDQGITYREIGRRIGLSRDYVAQLIQSAQYRRKVGREVAERRAP